MVLELAIDRGNHMRVVEAGDWSARIPPSITATFLVFDNRFAGDDPRRKLARVTIRFAEPGEFEVDGFNHQNPILGLGMCLVHSPERQRQMFLIDWGGSCLNHEVRFTCEAVCVESVTPEA